MENNEFKERMLEQKEIAKKLIDESEYFVVFTNNDIVGAASIIQTCKALINGIRTLVDEGTIPKFLVEEIIGLICAEDVHEYMKNKIKEMEEE